jgi:hypothetical protein
VKFRRPMGDGIVADFNQKPLEKSRGFLILYPSRLFNSVLLCVTKRRTNTEARWRGFSIRALARRSLLTSPKIIQLSHTFLYFGFVEARTANPRQQRLFNSVTLCATLFNSV